MARLVKWSYSEICEKVYKHFPKKSHGSFSQILQTKKGLQTPLITSILAMNTLKTLGHIFKI